MGSVYDYEPTGYREWFINSSKYRYGTIDKPTVLASDRLQDIVAISVLEAQLPYTFYTINSNNNTLYLRIATAVNPAIYIVYQVQLPVGNYTPDTLVTALLALNSPTQYLQVGVVATTFLSITGTNSVFSNVTYSSQTGRLTMQPPPYTTTAAGPFYPGYAVYIDTTTSYPNACVAPLGLAPNTLLPIMSPGNPGTALSVTMPYVIALGGPPYLMIRGSFGLGGNDNMVTCEVSLDRTTAGNILAAIPVNTVPGGTISWKNGAPRGGFFNFPVANLEEAQLWVTMGDDDTPVAFNGHPFQLKLGFLTRHKGSTFLGSKFTNDRGVTSSLMS